MKTRSMIALLALSLVACASEDGGLDGGAGCFAGEDMAWQYVVLVTVRDATTKALLPNPTFTIGVTAEGARCYVPGRVDNADLATGLCDTWNIERTGHYTLGVHAGGHADATVDVDTDYTLAHGCPAQRQVTATVDLQPL